MAFKYQFRRLKNYVKSKLKTIIELILFLWECFQAFLYCFELEDSLFFEETPKKIEKQKEKPKERPKEKPISHQNKTASRSSKIISQSEPGNRSKNPQFTFLNQIPIDTLSPPKSPLNFLSKSSKDAKSDLGSFRTPTIAPSELKIRLQESQKEQPKTNHVPEVKPSVNDESLAKKDESNNSSFSAKSEDLSELDQILSRSLSKENEIFEDNDEFFSLLNLHNDPDTASPTYNQCLHAEQLLFYFDEIGEIDFFHEACSIAFNLFKSDRHNANVKDLIGRILFDYSTKISKDASLKDFAMTIAQSTDPKKIKDRGREYTQWCNNFLLNGKS